MPDDRDALKARYRSLKSPGAPPPPVPDQSTTTPINSDLLNEQPQIMPTGFDQIKLKMRRKQSKAFLGGVGFSIYFIAEISPEAQKAIRYYRFGKTILYQKDIDLKQGGALKLLWHWLVLLLTRKRWQITVNDIVRGRTIECKDIIEMLEIEDRIKTASQTFAQVLRASAWFGGEEVIDL